MKLLRTIFQNVNYRHCAATSTSVDASWSYTKLIHRSIVRVKGDNALQFLQGIVTNDTRYLSRTNENRQSALFSMMLNTQGRLLYDLILYVKPDAIDDDEVYVECDRSVVSDLTKQLIFYRLRRKLELQPCDKEFNVYALFSKTPSTGMETPKIGAGSGKPFMFCNDPRVGRLGFRAIVGADDDAAKIFQARETVEDEYHALRYQLGVGEGCGDMPPGGSFPLESNGDYMNGISFHKGCYVGQELTARTHHTGVVRKRLMPLTFDADASKIRINAKVTDEKGGVLGKFRRSSGVYGLGLLYVQQALATPSMFVQLDEGEAMICRTEKPSWWDADTKVTREVRGFHSKTTEVKDAPS